MAGKLWSWRYLILRRLVQAGVIVLFAGSYHQAWELGGKPLLRGNLSAAELLGTVPLADPLAVLQLLVTGARPTASILLGAGLVVLAYALPGGRTFCSWVCPINPVTDLAGWLRRRLELKHGLKVGRDVRHWMLGLTLVLSTLLGVAAFEWISPIGMLHRGLIFGFGAGWAVVLGVFVLDLLVMRHGWCGHLCPLGAFYGLLGRAAQVRIAFDAASCTHCGECIAVCPEPQVLNLKQAAEVGMNASGDCTNCGRCTPVCPEGSLAFDWRVRIRTRARRVV